MNPISTALEGHKSIGTFRTLRVSDGLEDFSSNDYLGLSLSSRVRAKLLLEIENGCPFGSTGSRLLSGQTKIHERVEEFLQSIFQTPSALPFSSGFMANLGVMTIFSSLDAHFFSDEQNHASIVDGIRMSKSPKTVFRHNDMIDLEDQLSKTRSFVKVIVTESVFSMSGDLAPLQAMYALAKRFNAWLVVDEAHATGIFGETGLGCLSGLLSHDTCVVSIHTGSKALGGQGAFVLSSNEFRELMINRARSFIFSTGLSPLSALQMQFALAEILATPDIGKRLLKRAHRIRQKLSDFGMTISGESQIVPVILGSNEKTQKASKHLQEYGFDVRPIRSPTVPRGSELLRITLKSFHDEDTIGKFLNAMASMPI